MSTVLNYNVDASNSLIHTNLAGTFEARRFEAGKRSFYVVGTKADFTIAKGSCKAFKPTTAGEYNGQPAVFIGGLAELPLEQIDGNLWQLGDKKAKIGKLILGVLPNIPDALLNNILAIFKSRDDVTIATDRDVVECYRDGVGADSCMTGDDAKNMRVLADNGVKIIVASKNDDTARALLWDCNDGSVIVDRVYPNDSPLLPAINAWAKNNGYWIRDHHKLPSGSTHFTKGNRSRNDFEFTLKCEPQSDLFPYLDSFHHGDISNDHITLTTAGRGDVTFNSTDGQHSGQFAECSNCNEECCPDSSFADRNGETLCDDCAYCCSDCSDAYTMDDVTDIDGNFVCESCLDDGEYACCEHSGEWYHIDDMIVTEDGMVSNRYEDDYCYIESEGEYVNNDKCEYAEDTGQDHRRSDCRECDESGNWYYEHEGNGQETSDGWVHDDNLEGYVYCEDTERCVKSDDATVCAESGDYYEETTNNGEMTNRGFVSDKSYDSSEFFTDYDGLLTHVDDADSAGYVQCVDTTRYVKNADAYVSSESGEFVSQPLFCGVV